MRTFRDKTVVVTGASSGIGRATAIAFAAEGAHLILAARRQHELEETARRCDEARRATRIRLGRDIGGSARVVPTDVSIEGDVQRLVEETLAARPTIDVWVNNAGVTMFALLEQRPFSDHQRVIETNLYGSIFAARAVVPVFRRQGHGILINAGSLLSKVGHPYVPSYAISKFAVRGLTEALRAELADLRDVHVCTVLPYAVDTQHFEAAANELGRRVYAMPPVQGPERVARAIVGLARRPRRELHVPRYLRLGLALHVLWPRTTERLLLDAAARWHISDERQDTTLGNLFRPSPEPAGVRGERPPRLSAAALGLWAAGDLLRMQTRGMWRTLRGEPRQEA